MNDKVPVNCHQAIVFDFDGTLVDSYEAIAASVNHVRSSHGLPPLSTAEVRRHVGRGPIHLLRHTVPNSDIEIDLAKYRAHHPSVLRSGTRLLPGVAKTLRELKEAGFRLGICSNKPGAFTRQLVEILGLTGLVNAVVGPEDAPRIKPAPDMLLAILSRLAVTPAQALYVGDMVVDVETARAAGVTVWVIPTGSDSEETLAKASADRLLGSFSEIAALLIGGRTAQA
jgi:phosphoglycolate phosphatase